jgi:hypothetical protein
LSLHLVSWYIIAACSIFKSMGIVPVCTQRASCDTVRYALPFLYLLFFALSVVLLCSFLFNGFNPYRGFVYKRGVEFLLSTLSARLCGLNPSLAWQL